jgi:hypothetical protein
MMVRLPTVQKARIRKLLPLMLLPALALLSGAPAATATDGVDPCVAAGGTSGHGATVGLLTCTFASPGSYAFTVPTGASSATVTALGAQGGDYSASRLGGKGASAAGTFSTLSGTKIDIVVGGAGGHTGDAGTGGYPDGGAGGANLGSNLGGAGGGGSSSATVFGSLLVIAGGGGGAGDGAASQPGAAGGAGGNAGVGQSGFPGDARASGGTIGATGGTGGADPANGTPGIGGAGGPGGHTIGSCSQSSGGTAGSTSPGAHGGAGAASNFTFPGAGGGGGGGYAGGGGGGSGARCDSFISGGGGGGGGSSFVATSATSPQILQNGSAPRTGDGMVTVAYQLPAPKNLIKDGGFETPVASSDVQAFFGGTIGPWSVSGSVELVTSGYWQPAEGAQSVDLAGTAPGGVTYTFTAPYADSYKVTFKLAGNPDCAPVTKQVGVYWNGALVSSPTFSTTGQTRASMGWKAKSVTVAGLPGSVSLAFVAISTGPCGPVIDKVAVKYL